MTNTYKVWRCIQNYPGIGTHALIQKTGMTREEVEHGLQSLRRNGFIEIRRIAGDGRIRRYHPIKGNRLHQDGRGKQPGSREALRMEADFRRGKGKPKPWTLPPPATTLEAVWRSRASQVDESQNLCGNRGGPVRPEFDEAA
jgi:hypothetical protein